MCDKMVFVLCLLIFCLIAPIRSQWSACYGSCQANNFRELASPTASSYITQVCLRYSDTIDAITLVRWSDGHVDDTVYGRIKAGSGPYCTPLLMDGECFSEIHINADTRISGLKFLTNSATAPASTFGSFDGETQKITQSADSCVSRMRLRASSSIFAVSFYWISTLSPTAVATSSNIPTSAPTNVRTLTPTTNAPSSLPANGPSSFPSLVPSSMPTLTPSRQPTMLPSRTPTTITGGTSSSPTVASSQTSTGFQTKVPSSDPTIVPTLTPSEKPTIVPSEVEPTFELELHVCPIFVVTVASANHELFDAELFDGVYVLDNEKQIYDRPVWENAQHDQNIHYTGSNWLINGGDGNILSTTSTELRSPDEIEAAAEWYHSSVAGIFHVQLVCTNTLPPLKPFVTSETFTTAGTLVSISNSQNLNDADVDANTIHLEMSDYQALLWSLFGCSVLLMFCVLGCIACFCLRCYSKQKAEVLQVMDDRDDVVLMPSESSAHEEGETPMTSFHPSNNINFTEDADEDGDDIDDDDDAGSLALPESPVLHPSGDEYEMGEQNLEQSSSSESSEYEALYDASNRTKRSTTAGYTHLANTSSCVLHIG